MSYKNSVLPVIREVRGMLLPFYGAPETIKEKPDKSIVTELDLKVEEFLAEKLKKLHPEIQFAGEETGGSRDAERFWLADPIDGTLNFARGLPFATTMLALIQEGEVIFSAIYDFASDHMYVAEKNSGAECNGVPIHVSNHPLRGSIVGWETHSEKSKNANISKALDMQCYLFRSFTAGFEFAMVASGKLDARISFDPYGKDYDYAPGALLVKEAGGIVTNIGKDSYDFRDVNLIAANPQIYKDLTSGPDAIFKT